MGPCLFFYEEGKCINRSVIQKVVIRENEEKFGLI